MYIRPSTKFSSILMIFGMYVEINDWCTDGMQYDPIQG